MRMSLSPGQKGVRGLRLLAYDLLELEAVHSTPEAQELGKTAEVTDSACLKDKAKRCT